MPPRFAVVGLGALPRTLLAEVSAALTAAFGAPAAAEGAHDRPAYAYNESRRQYHASAILRRLAQARPPSHPPVLGVTDVDLFVPDAPWVLGEADRDAGAAVVSIARLAHGLDGRPADPERLRRRAEVEAVHEIGHLLGLSHCPDARCAMFLSHKPSDSDRKTGGLCASCRSALGLAAAT